jgi:protein involved in polysaccharide export with SLBB domain
MLSGEVTAPQALVHDPGATVSDYVARVGGFSNRANPDQILIVRRSGEVLTNGDLEEGGVEVKAGDEILVLPEVPVKNLQIASTIINSIFQIAVMAGILLAL